MNKELNRCIGSLLGLAAGDALGTTLEFRTPGTFTPITDIVGGGPFGLTVGKWTDDTSMALCLADSLIEKEGFDACDQLDKYLKWYSEGYNSSTGHCFDIGNATRQALFLYESSGQPYCGDSSRESAGNGSIMRLAPIPIFYYKKPEELYLRAELSSKTTHSARQCIDACKYMAGIIGGAIQGRSKEDLLASHFSMIDAYWEKNPLDPTIAEVAEGSFKTKQPPGIYGSGYVVKTLEAALWAFYHTSDFESGALKVVNLGDDADSTGAVYGQIAGAYYGLDGIPKKWRDKLYRGLDIEISAECLYQLAQKQL